MKRRHLGPYTALEMNAMGEQMASGMLCQALAGASASPEASGEPPVLAYMSVGGLLFVREGNYLIRQTAETGPLLVSDAIALYGPLVELVSRPDWNPPAAGIVGYLDCYGTYWKAAPYDGSLVYAVDAAEPSLRYEIERTCGPLTPLVPIGGDHQTALWVPEPEVKQDPEVPSPAPDPLGMFGFDGKWVECSRRTPAGPWCEWRKNTHMLSLGVLVTLAREHTEQVHSG